MNWKAIIPLVIIVGAIYALWTWLSRSQANPTTQEAFDSPSSQIDVIAPADLQLLPAQEMITNEIPAVVPEETVSYDTIYNIVVEAPVIPELNTSQIIDDIVKDIAVADKDPITQPTGGEDQLILTRIKPTGRTYSTIKAIQEKTVKPIYDPVEMVTDTARPSGSFGGR